KADLGDGYAETLRSVYPDVPESADFVMYWWHKAAELAAAGKIRRFGFITTNSISQSFNRRVVQRALDGGLGLAFAVSDHPWVDTADGAAVRIAMTTAAPGISAGQLLEIAQENPPSKNSSDGASDLVFRTSSGRINADLSTGADVSRAVALQANERLSVNGMMLAGRGFVVTHDEAKELGVGSVPELAHRIRPIRNGRDLTDKSRNLFVIDMFGLDHIAVRKQFPAVYDHLIRTVKPERDANARTKLREDWWLFGEVRKTLRAAIAGLPRYIATAETAKHRIFLFLPADIVPEHKLVAIALDDGFRLGVLSSQIHVVFALAAGSWLGVGNDPVYAKSRCFDPFPFPDCTEKQKDRIRKLAEELDAHRKRVQAKHGLGLTDIYNVLEKVRAGEELSAKDKAIHDAALVATLRQLHDDLDRAVAEAYGWPWPLTEAEILQRVVGLNAARAAEEKAGVVRWLRPDYQAKGELMLEGGSAHRPKAKPAKAKKPGKLAWPAKPA
ncbi:MAG TPA: hypothetical protein PLG56_12410, partial [Lacunisphaera sp.]|nr:hypothetical protein [Lacunisphaera sp.]